MRNILIAALLAVGVNATAQTETSVYQPGVTEEGAVYFLPRTVLRFSVLVERTTYTPGDFCKYAGRYLRLNGVETQGSVKYSVAGISLATYGEADKNKAFSVKFNAKSVAANVALADDGTLLAINTAALTPQMPQPYKAAPRQKLADPHRLLNEEILSAGSTAKMAELTAQEIYDIRESKNYLNRGEADFMPSDGEQLRIMLNNLDEQDRALTSMFTGTTTRDTLEYVLTICPMSPIERQVLFRISQKTGLVAPDDLSGKPFYISVEDAKSLPATAEVEQSKKKSKANGVYVNVPGKAVVTVYDGNTELDTFEVNMAQFGNVELLGGELFNKRYTTRLTLNPATGAVDRLEAEQPK